MAVLRAIACGRTWYPLTKLAGNPCCWAIATPPRAKSVPRFAGAIPEHKRLLRTAAVVRAAAEGPYDATGYVPEEYYVPVAPEKIRPAVQYYKGRAGAITLNFTLPRWKEYVKKGENDNAAAGSGPQQQRLVLDREGALILEFAKSIGDKTYDWANKGVFALSPTELAGVLEYLGEEHSFFHDPGMLSSNQGQVTKNLKITPNQNAKDGWYLSLSVTPKGQTPLRYSLPVTRAEMAEIKILSYRLIPVMRGLEDTK